MISLILNTLIIKRKGITLICIFKTQKRVKKLVSILARFILVSVTRKEAIETAETAGNVGTGEDSKSGKYPETNFTQVPYI